MKKCDRKKCDRKKIMLGFVFALALLFLSDAPAYAKTQSDEVPSVKIKSVTAKSYHSVAIQWKKASGVSGYQVYRSVSKSKGYERIATVKSAKTVQYTDEEVTTGKKYYYKVRAYLSEDEEKVYGEFSAIKSATPALSKVKGASAKAVNGNKVKLTWKKVSGAKSYKIFRSTSKHGTYKLIKSGVTKTSYTNSGLTGGKKYYYKVAAVRGKTMGKNSSIVGAKAATLELSREILTVQKGKKATIIATVSPNATVKWSSSDTKVAKVSTKGVVTGVKKGSATISAKANGFTVKAKVTVKVGTLNGIDVSKWQGKIDFEQVKESGVDVVMIRVYNGVSKDPYFESNYKKAKAAGLDIGVYYYTYATSVKRVEADTKKVLKILKGRSLQYPVTIDMEDSSLLDGLSNKARTDILWAFCSTVRKNSNYQYALYANLNWLNNYFEKKRLLGMPVWIARYCDASLGHRYSGKGEVFMWQYTSQGTIPGIVGNVDQNFVY